MKADWQSWCSACQERTDHIRATCLKCGGTRGGAAPDPRASIELERRQRDSRRPGLVVISVAALLLTLVVIIVAYTV
jgi:ferric-dicitrate binding protein FerR (iron transport regulator)